MRKPKTQKDAILLHFYYGNSLTSLQAANRQFGYCVKLPTRISEYTKLGFVFTKNKITKKSIFGEPCYFFEYRMDIEKTPKLLIKNFLNSIK